MSGDLSQPIPSMVASLIAFGRMGDPRDRRKLCDVTMASERFERFVELVPPILRFVDGVRAAERHLKVAGIIFRPIE